MTDTQPQIFEPEGRAIPYVEDAGSEPVLVLIPGYSNVAALGTLAHVLAEEDFRILRVGYRTAQTEGVTLHDLAQDVVDVMDHVGLGDAWVGGHAFGGTDRVDGVLLLGAEGDEPRTDLEPLQAAAAAAVSLDEWRALAPTVPVMLIQGADDDVLPPANGERLQAAAPGLVSLVTLEGGGHLFPATHAGEAAFVIEDYLDVD
jgi:pimeloyl-ACP methyl ester carboxylesterase